MFHGATRRQMVWLASALLLSSVDATLAREEQQEPKQGQAGYENIPVFGGPEGVSGQLKQADEVREARYQFDGLQRAFEPYFDWKRQLKDEFGVAFGFQYYLLPQYASASQDENDAVGGIFRFQGSWTLFGRDGINPGRIEWRVAAK